VYQRNNFKIVQNNDKDRDNNNNDDILAVRPKAYAKFAGGID